MPVPYYPLKITKKEWESPSACSFYFAPLEENKALFAYRPAQFLSFRFQIGGKEHVRSYSIASCPLRNEPLRTTVGRVEGGVVSSYMLSQLKEGDHVESQAPLGEFFRPPKSLQPKHYFLFSAGIGITPLFSILKSLLEADLAQSVFLLFSIRNPEDFIYKKELKEEEAKFQGKFKLQTVVSSQQGRLTPEKLKHILKPVAGCLQHSLFYLCGPKPYMQMLADTLGALGVNSGNIHTEDFKTAPVLGPKPQDDSVFFKARGAVEGEPELLKARWDNQSAQIPLNREKPLLEQLIDQGHNPPFSCTSGNCMTCMARLKEGKVFQLEEGILDEENIKNLEILTCQAYPLSKTVSVDYDSL